MRSKYIDALKGISIVAVVLYHMGICKYGYLGVDAFFVIAGYFTLKSLRKTSEKTWTYYFHFLKHRFLRLLPLLIFASIICALWGLYFMLPDDYENLCESIVATTLFSNNILSCITTHNYWDVVNEYKPLMHTWYVGVLMQYYLLFPALFILSFKICRRKIDGEAFFKKILYCTLLFSFCLFLFQDNDAERFYYVQYRLYEFCLGGAVLYYSEYNDTSRSNIGNYISGVLYTLFVILIFSDIDFLRESKSQVILVCIITAGILYTKEYCSNTSSFNTNWLSLIGKCSYSIFVWHQVILAFIRYSYTDNLFDFHIIAPYLIILILLTWFSYKFIENLPDRLYIYLIGMVMFLFVNSFSLFIFANAGVTRDVPELDIYSGHQKRGMHAEYNERAYAYDQNFKDKSNKEKWLVIGNSFGRDWINIILESKIKDSIDISYMNDVFINELIKNDPKAITRVKDADLVFYSTKGVNHTKIEFLKRYYLPKGKKMYIVGEKNFGKSNGVIYRHRGDADYYNYSVYMEEGYQERNIILKNKYRDNFVDMISPVSRPDGKVRVFTNDRKYISQDCRHLTKSGAQFYASLIDISAFLSTCNNNDQN